MRLRSIFIGGFLVFAVILIPFQTKAQTVGEDAYRMLLLQLIEVLQQQISVLQAELVQQVEPEPQIETVINRLGDSVSVNAVYDIGDARDVDRISNREHREYFTRVFELFPDKYDDMIKRLEVYGGEDAIFDAYVETIPPKHEYWKYSVNSDVVEDDDEAGTELIVHELAHIISYEGIPGVPEPYEVDCEDYFDIHGCPAENSYLREFVDTFWSSSDLRRAEKFAEFRDPFDEIYAYYELNEDEYVSDYAAGAPEEDFSESFMQYVLGDDTERGTIAREKVDFFRNYSMLVTIRREILNNI